MKRHDQSRDTRARAMAAARALFEVHPYRDVTIRQIAAKVGRAQPTLYRYWPDKAALWREVMGCHPPANGEDLTSMRRHGQAREDLLEEVRALLGEARRPPLPADVEGVLRRAIDVLNQRSGEGEQASAPKPMEERAMRTSASRRRRGAPILRASDELIGQRLRAQRRALGFTQADIAAALGVSTSQAARYELGEAPLPASLVANLAAMLGCSLETLIGADR